LEIWKNLKKIKFPKPPLKKGGNKKIRKENKKVKKVYNKNL